MGIVDRAKEMASKKKHEFDEGVEKEKRYTAYKHPDADYIVHGQRPYGPKTKAESEEADEFASRKSGEEAKAAERRERSKEKKARIRSAIKEKAGNVARNLGNKVVSAMREKPRSHAPAPPQDPVFGGGGSGFKFGMGCGMSGGFNLGMGSGKGPNPFGGKMKDPLGFGGKRKKQAKFSLF